MKSNAERVAVIVMLMLGATLLTVYVNASYHEYLNRSILASYGISSTSSLRIWPVEQRGEVSWAYTKPNMTSLRELSKENYTSYNSLISKITKNEDPTNQTNSLVLSLSVAWWGTLMAMWYWWLVRPMLNRRSICKK